MDLGTILKALLPVEPANLKTDSGALNVGDRLLGRVLNLHEDGKVTMAFGKFKAMTEVPIDVKVGQTLPLEIVQTGNPLKMRIVAADFMPASGPAAGASERPASGISPAAMQQLASDLKLLESNLSTAGPSSLPPSLRTALQSLNTFFSGLDPTSDSRQMAVEIQQKVENSGLFFEKKMEVIAEALSKHQTDTLPEGSRSSITEAVHRDAKPNALMLLDFLEKSDPTDSKIDPAAKERLQSGLKEMLTDLANQSAIAKERLSTADPFQLFHFTLPFINHKESAKLKLYYAKKQKKDRQDQPMVSILLDLERLGPIRSDLVMLQKDLAVTFYVRDAKIKTLVEEQAEAVRIALKGVFENITLAVRVSEKKIKAFDAPVLPTEHEYKVDLRI